MKPTAGLTLTQRMALLIAFSILIAALLPMLIG